DRVYVLVSARLLAHIDPLQPGPSPGRLQRGPPNDELPADFAIVFVAAGAVLDVPARLPHGILLVVDARAGSCRIAHQRARAEFHGRRQQYRVAVRIDAEVMLDVVNPVMTTALDMVAVAGLRLQREG